MNELIRDLEAIEAEQHGQLVADCELVDELCNIDRGLSEWELDFIESIGDHVDAGNLLSKFQREKAEEILKRIEERGR